MKAVLVQMSPEIQVIDLLADAPAHNPKAAAYLLAALAPEFPAGTVFLCVVDPGVGSDRPPVIVEADKRWFVGPDNGLFEITIRRATGAQRWDINWRPERMSASFHGRDLFAPVAARLARGEPPPGQERAVSERRYTDWPDELQEIVYIDHFGNAMTGFRAGRLSPDTVLEASGTRIPRARTFSDVPPHTPFWYENSNGLAEIAVSQGRADEVLGLRIGARIAIRAQGASHTRSIAEPATDR